MLKQVALILASPKYDHLITLSPSTLTIHNQYVFLWSVLPKVSGTFTRRTQFVKEMKSYGFELANERGTDKQNNRQGEVQDQKSLVFKAKCYDFMSSLGKIQQIKHKRMQQKALLDQRIKSLSSKMQSMKGNGGQDMAQQYELFEEILSLNKINRNILMQNEEIDCLMYSSLQLKSITMGQETTYQMLSFCFDNENTLPTPKYKMKSSKNLRELQKAQ